MRLRFIDPANCGCTDCLTGYAVPLSQATDTHIGQLIDGTLAWRGGSSGTLVIEITIALDLDEPDDGLTNNEFMEDIQRVRDFARRTTAEVHGYSFNI